MRTSIENQSVTSSAGSPPLSPTATLVSGVADKPSTILFQREDQTKEQQRPTSEFFFPPEERIGNWHDIQLSYLKMRLPEVEVRYNN